jgi:dTDP-4-amino-4,6-dideoxygalactose transaminase
MLIPMAKPILGEEEAVKTVLFSGGLAQGKKVEEFEADFAA